MGLAASLAAFGCARDEARWALQHATIDSAASAEAFSGYQVWELFSKRWRKKRKEKFHICARVQEIAGEATGELSGCDGCTETFELTVANLESDCDAEQASVSVPTHFGFGTVPEDLREDSPYPGQTLGWYVSFDGQSAEILGYAWNEGLDLGEVVDDPGWTGDQRYILWPAYAWEL